MPLARLQPVRQKYVASRGDNWVTQAPNFDTPADKL